MVADVGHEVIRMVLDRYSSRTKRSLEHHTRAVGSLPGGDTRNSTFFMPYPTYMERGRGCTITDCDGNEYIDFLNLLD
jgi:glutamate-1-semialdehyde 2,1-aminomutase